LLCLSLRQSLLARAAIKQMADEVLQLRLQLQCRSPLQAPPFSHPGQWRYQVLQLGAAYITK
jgi:hypothetical protein